MISGLVMPKENLIGELSMPMGPGPGPTGPSRSPEPGGQPGQSPEMGPVLGPLLTGPETNSCATLFAAEAVGGLSGTVSEVGCTGLVGACCTVSFLISWVGALGFCPPPPPGGGGSGRLTMNTSES